MLESLFNKVAGLKACNFTKKGTPTQVFFVNIAKFLRTPFFTEHLRWLLLDFSGKSGEIPLPKISIKAILKQQKSDVISNIF